MKIAKIAMALFVLALSVSAMAYQTATFQSGVSDASGLNANYNADFVACGAGRGNNHYSNYTQCASTGWNNFNNVGGGGRRQPLGHHGPLPDHLAPRPRPVCGQRPHVFLRRPI